MKNNNVKILFVYAICFYIPFSGSFAPTKYLRFTEEVSIMNKMIDFIRLFHSIVSFKQISFIVRRIICSCCYLST